MHKTQRNAFSIGAFSMALLFATACGSDAKKSGDASTTTASGSSTTLVGGTTTTSSGSDCQNAIPAVEAAIRVYNADASVTVDGSCSVDVTTKLEKTADNVSLAMLICGAASGEAYSTGATGVRVLSADNHELAISVKDQNCVGEP